MSKAAGQPLNPYEILESLAFREAAAAVTPAAGHNSRIARVAPGSWQARLLAENADLRHVRDFDDLRAALADPAAPVLFIGDAVVLSAAALDRACAAAGLDKIIIWEDAGTA